jgi:hypothetical protein
MKKLSILLAERERLLRQARLANLAFTYQSLSSFAERIARAQLRGAVMLKPVAPHEERYCATLTALEGSQSIIEEHFTDEDLVELTDAIGFTTGHNGVEITFRLEELAEVFLAPLRAELERKGVAIDAPAAPGAQVEEPRQ